MRKKGKEIENKYALRVEEENINAIYDLEKWVGFYEQVIKDTVISIQATMQTPSMTSSTWEKSSIIQRK